MNFIQIQIVIFLSIIISAFIGGKKASLMATAVWVVQTFIVYKISSMNYLQIITLSLSFQLGLIIAVARDFIVKRIKKSSTDTSS